MRKAVGEKKKKKTGVRKFTLPVERLSLACQKFPFSPNQASNVKYLIIVFHSPAIILWKNGSWSMQLSCWSA